MKQNYGLLSRGRNLLSTHGLKAVYYAHIYSHMSYCITVWGSMINSEMLNKLRVQQNRCICIINTRMTIPELYQTYKILDIESVIDVELCKLGYKLNTSNLPVNLLTSLKGDARGKTLEKKKHL